VTDGESKGGDCDEVHAILEETVGQRFVINIFFNLLVLKTVET